MSSKVFQDDIFPRHVSDLMNLMHMVVFNGTDGEEKWDTYLQLIHKEYVALGLAQYYQCEHCIEFHSKAICHADKISKKTLSKNINSIILFLRIDTRTISKTEQKYWIQAWQKFATEISAQTGDQEIPYLIGLAIGIARDDQFLIKFCGSEVNKILTSKGIDLRSAIGELESVVIFMKAAASKNRVVGKINQIFDSIDTPE